MALYKTFIIIIIIKHPYEYKLAKRLEITYYCDRVEPRSRNCDHMVTGKRRFNSLVVVLPDSFREMGARRNSTESQPFKL